MKNIVVIGGGTAGWMTAAGLVSMMEGLNLNITLIESEAIATVGVGEATLPHIKFFNEAIGIDEAEFMRATSATFKLGIEFVDWGHKGQSYIHPFGEFGLANAAIPFHHYWRKLSGDPRVGSLQDYSLPIVACRHDKFDRPSNDPKSVKSTYRYAYQFDSLKYAPFLRRHGEARGVTRIEGKVVDVELQDETGDILSVRLEDGSVVEGDLFIDCTGFYGLLIEKSLETGYDKWTEWLPVDRAVAVPCEHVGPLHPYTRATADEAGWRWRIPLQNRTGNGYVYASDFISDEAAEDRLLDCLEGAPQSAPRRLRFTTGKRRKLWHKNCVAIGLSGGFLEPLESTSIYLIQEGITKLLELFPDVNDLDVSRREYNRLMDLEFERIRDFLILHYHATKRDDTPFWDYVRSMKIPDSLSEKMELFNQSGRVVRYDFGLFLEPSWIAVYMGQDYHPMSYDPRVDLLPETDIAQHLLGLKHLMKKTVSAMQSHDTFIDHHELR